MGYFPTNELIRRGRKKKWCAVVQTKYRQNDTQHSYSDCRYRRQPEPREFIHGIGLHYPIIPEKEVDYECENICEDEAILLSKTTVEEVPRYMQPVTSSYEKSTRHVLVFPHRHKPPFKQPQKPCLAQQHMILEPFKTLSYEGLDYLQSCLSFKSILDKLDTAGKYSTDIKARAVALRLLLHLPPLQFDSEQGPATTTGRVHNRVYLSAKGKHHRVLTPRCDTSIIEQMGRTSAITLLQKCLRGRALQMSMEKTRKRWEESYEELNGFNISYQADPDSGMGLVTYATEMTIVRAVTGQYISPALAPLVRADAELPDPLERLDDGLDGDDQLDDPPLWGQLVIHR